jgi:hypothetical protein
MKLKEVLSIIDLHERVATPGAAEIALMLDSRVAEEFDLEWLSACERVVEVEQEQVLNEQDAQVVAAIR